MIELFLSGGAGWMSVLTVELIALLLAAWKAPGWVKEIGLLAMITGFLDVIFGFAQAAKAVVLAGEISTSLLWGGFRWAMIPIGYGLIIYGISLIIRIVRKPRYL